MIYVIPQLGMKVPDPAQLTVPDRHLPPEGRLVERSGYWERRLRDGDVSIGTAPMIDAPADGIEKTPIPPGTEISGDPA